MKRSFSRLSAWWSRVPSKGRRGGFQVLALSSLTAALGLVAFSIDISVISLTKTRMQNAVDAAALAAAQEITAAVAAAGQSAGSSGDVAGAVADANSIAVDAAKAMAANVANLNGVYVDPDRDVEFGKRVYQNGNYVIQWGVGPYNVVKVTARRDNGESGQPDSKLSLFFAGVTGSKTASLTASAIAFVQARDIVMVLDYSASMNDDSTYAAFSTLGQTNVEANMADIYNALAPTDGSLTASPQWLTLTAPTGSKSASVTFMNTSVDVTTTSTLTSAQLTFSNGSTQTITGLTGTLKKLLGTGSNNGKTIDQVWVRTVAGGSTWTKFVDSTANVKTAFGLNSVTYPYASGSWDAYIDYVRTDSTVNSAGYRRKYGGNTFVQYLLTQQVAKAKTKDLWKTPHYPFHAMKEGATLFTEFLEGLEFGDHLGLVDYADTAVIETQLNDADIPAGDHVNLGADWITDNYAAIDAIQRHKQAGHYTSNTNIGGGLKKAKELLDAKQRYGSRPTVLLMTDGQANRYDSGFSMPAGWNWNDLTDYDGDGVANYTTTDTSKRYAFAMAKQLIDQGVTIHTLTVGAGADRDLMKAIAFAAGGQYIDCPGGSSVAAMQGQLLTAFGKIAANVPPPKLLADPDAP